MKNLYAVISKGGEPFIATKQGVLPALKEINGGRLLSTRTLRNPDGDEYHVFWRNDAGADLHFLCKEQKGFTSDNGVKVQFEDIGGCND